MGGAPGLVAERGTAVRLQVAKSRYRRCSIPDFSKHPAAPFSTPADPAFDEFLGGTLSQGRRDQSQRPAAGEAALDRRAAGAFGNSPAAQAQAFRLGYLIREEHPLSEDRRGLAISTYGKVIRRGWDWMGMTPAAAGTHRRPDRSAGAWRLPDPQQGRLHPRRRPRRDLSGVSQSDSRSGRPGSSHSGAMAERAPKKRHPGSAAATARSRASTRRPGAGLSLARVLWSSKEPADKNVCRWACAAPAAMAMVSSRHRSPRRRRANQPRTRHPPRRLQQIQARPPRQQWCMKLTMLTAPTAAQFNCRVNPSSAVQRITAWTFNSRTVPTTSNWAA